MNLIMIENYREPFVITYLVLQTSRFHMNIVNIEHYCRSLFVKSKIEPLKNTLLLISCVGHL